MGLDLVLSGCAITAELALIILLVKTRAFRSFPFFFSYILLCLLSDVLLPVAQAKLSASTYFQTFWVETLIDSAMMVAVLVELAWSVLRPVRASLPKYSWLALVFFVLIAGVVLWFVAGLTLPAAPPREILTAEGLKLVRLQQTFAILRLIVFLAMAGFSQVLSIGWRNRELQVATGLGLFSIVSLAVSIMHTHQAVNQPQYLLLEQVVAASYVCSLTYWVYAFATKEAVRQEFSPQMQQLFLAVAGSARADRVSLSESTSSRPRKRDDR